MFREAIRSFINFLYAMVAGITLTGIVGVIIATGLNPKMPMSGIAMGFIITSTCIVVLLCTLIASIEYYVSRGD